MDWHEAFERELKRIEAEKESEPLVPQDCDQPKPKSWSDAINHLLIEYKKMAEQQHEPING